MRPDNHGIGRRVVINALDVYRTLKIAQVAIVQPTFRIIGYRLFDHPATGDLNGDIAAADSNGARNNLDI